MATKKTEVTSSTAKEFEESFSQVCRILTGIKDEQFMREFLDCLVSPAERKDLAKRWCLVKALYAGTTQREIAKKYNLSLCNITRGSKELKKENSAFRRVLEGEISY